jgi:hypothetical protein
MYFDAYGPFRVAIVHRKITAAQRPFWKEVRDRSAKYEYDSDELERSFGAYVFGIKWGSNLTPWYVGQTVAKTGFRGEIFQFHKQKICNRVMRKNNGTPVMFLFPLLTPEDRFSHSRTEPNKLLVDWVEKMLLGLALAKNEYCRNKRSTKFLRECTVNGVMGPHYAGRPEKQAAQARALLFPPAV